MGVIADRLRAAMNAARKSRDAARTLLYSTVLADLKNKEFELQRAVSDEDEADVLRRAVKRRQEAAELYDQGGRKDLAGNERREVEAIKECLPADASAEDIRRAVQAAIQAGAKDVGAVMKAVMPQFKGRADGKAINQIAREELHTAV
ncbi:MAG: GatB/YqeY domain-containing protein [Gemmatimonadales bacterium]